MKNFFIAASLTGVGVWYLHHVIDDRPRTPKPEPAEMASGEIVVANAPDGSLQGRWPGSTPAPAHR